MSPFWRKDSEFSRYLERLAALNKDLAAHPSPDAAMIARNYLLDERLSDERAEQYEAVFDEGPTDYGHLASLADSLFGPSASDLLVQRHRDYFKGHVGLDDSWPNGPAGPLDRLAEHHTFRERPKVDTYGCSDSGLILLRVERLSFVEQRSGRSDLRREIEQYLRNRADKHLEGSLDAALDSWHTSCDLRPVFAMFEGEVMDGTDLSGPWADRLRNWAGLRHLVPAGAASSKVPVVLFRYTVGDIPKFRGDSTYPLVSPTVLDGSEQPNAAFCPAPLPGSVGEEAGCAVCLDCDDRIVHEVVHPSFPFHAKHVVAIGEIGSAPSTSLVEARNHHFLKVRLHCARHDFGDLTEQP